MGVLAVVLIALLVVFFLLAASVLLPVRLRFRATFVNGKLKYDASIRLPLIPRYLALPDLARVARRRKPEAREDDPATGAEGDAPPVNTPQVNDIHSRIAALQQTFETFRAHYPEISSLASHVAHSVTIHEFRVCSRLGTGDAAETALLAGGLRASFGVVLGVMRHLGMCFGKRPVLHFVPVYERAHFSADVMVISSVVPLRALIAFFRFMRHVRKSKPKSQSAVSKAVPWNTRA